MTTPEKLIPLPELIKQTKALKNQLYLHMLIQHPEVKCTDIDDIVALREEMKEGEKLALYLFGHMMENGIYK